MFSLSASLEVTLLITYKITDEQESRSAKVECREFKTIFLG